MLVFKRGFYELVKSLVLAAAAGGMIAFLGSAFATGAVLYIAYFAAFAASAFLIYEAFGAENIKFEIDGGQLRYYIKNKLEAEYSIDECGFGYDAKGENGSYDYITLHISGTAIPGDTTDIDCSSLGFGKFIRMFEILTEDKNPSVIEVTKKEN